MSTHSLIPPNYILSSDTSRYRIASLRAASLLHASLQHMRMQDVLKITMSGLVRKTEFRLQLGSYLLLLG